MAFFFRDVNREALLMSRDISIVELPTNSVVLL